MSQIIETVTPEMVPAEGRKRFTTACRSCGHCTGTYNWVENARDFAAAHARVFQHTVDITDEEAVG